MTLTPGNADPFSQSSLSIHDLLKRRKILITCGTGGVGKTTVSAALAIRAAQSGRRTAVITIDPAKRLGTSLGIEALGDQPTDITETVRKTSGMDIPAGGQIHAIMPDTLKTFEQFVRDLTPSEVAAERVLRNPIFQIFAKEFSGTNEYMAMQKLHALERTGLYDCIILDTPPSRNTLDFLDAPKLLARFFDDRLIQWLVLPTNRLLSAGMRKALGLLERLTGAGFMTHLYDFAAALFEVRVTFLTRVKEISALLESGQVGFLLVSTPSPEKTPEAGHFIRAVQDHDFHFDGIILNRTLGHLQIPQGWKEDLTQSEWHAAFQVLEDLQTSENQILSSLWSEIQTQTLGKTQEIFATRLPELARDVHSLEDLGYVALALDRSMGISR